MIPFLDLQAQYKNIKQEVESAVMATLASAQYVLGPEVAAFEDEFAEYCGGGYGVAVNSGTSALHLSLLAAGVGVGDEVITVSNTFVATVAAIDYVGAKPVFVDIDPFSLNMDPLKIEAVVTSRTKAIIPVHLHGQAADMDPIMGVASRFGLAVIEDAAQAHGAEYKGRRVGAIGDFGCFSFYPGKNLGACGEGGMVITNDKEFSHKLKVLRDWGQEGKYHHTHKGFNYRMDGIQAAILRVKLKYLDKWTSARRSHAALYGNCLSGAELSTADEMSYAKHVYHVYSIQSDNRDFLRSYLTEKGVGTNIHYPIPVHLQKAYMNDCEGGECLPVTENVAGRLLSLPMFPELTANQIEQVCETIYEALRC
jgi:dTDP-4-amino-4,6-dideoxygalactose transaminase